MFFSGNVPPAGTMALSEDQDIGYAIGLAARAGVQALKCSYDYRKEND